jgi:peptide deformylase
MQILTYPHSSLLTKCKRSSVAQKTINQMFILLGQSGGLALAANQVGLDTHVFVTSWGQVFQNLVIYDYTEEMEIDEGCLSPLGRRINVSDIRILILLMGVFRYSSICNPA